MPASLWKSFDRAWSSRPQRVGAWAEWEELQEQLWSELALVDDSRSLCELFHDLAKSEAFKEPLG